MIALLIAVLLAAPPGTPPAVFARDATGAAANGQTVTSPPAPRVQRIAILPDRTTGRDWGLPYLRAAVEDFQRVRPDAVFTVGDMVQGYTRNTAQWDAEADEYLAIVGGIPAPFYPTAGNHDVISGTRVAGDDTFAARYRTRFGPLWYAVDLDLATALVLFSDEGLGDRTLRIGPEQFAWLQSALQRAAARGKPIFVLMHRPLWHSASVEWGTRIQPLLEQAGVKAVIAGHFHSMQREPDTGGVQYHILGTCGGMIDQPPLAGQLQHVSFIDATSDGDLRIWHMPVGSALPDDFIRAEDQQRVWDLREPASAITLKGAWPGPVELVVANPTNVPITITRAPHGLIHLTRGGPPLWWTAGGDATRTLGGTGGTNGWTSHTAFDIDNPHTMSREALAIESPAGPVIAGPIAPGASATIPLRVRYDPSALPPDAPPPQLDLYAVFTDSRGREVPVYLPTRMPVARAVELGTDVDQAHARPIVAWAYSPYDTREANPTLRAALEGTPPAQLLVLRVDTPDRHATGAPDPGAPPARHAANPPADAVLITLTTPAGAHSWLAEPFTAGWAPPPGLTIRHLEQYDEAWHVVLSVPWPAGVQPDQATLQVGVADNDATYHTQWRWLAPAGAPARLVAPPAPTP